MSSSGTERGAARLIIRLEGEPDREVSIGPGGSIGRGPENAFVIQHPSVSRRHAEIRADSDGGYSIVDLGSLNGIALNGLPLSAPRVLYHADELSIGEAALLFLHESGPARSDVGDVAWHGIVPDREVEVDLDALRMLTLFCDIRSCASLAQKLPAAAYQGFLLEWWEEARALLRRHGARVDPSERDALLVYWPIEHSEAPRLEVNEALRGSIALWRLARTQAKRFVERFEIDELQVMAGLHIGDARAIKHVGDETWRIEGSLIAATARLAELHHKEACAIVTSWDVAQWATPEFRFHNLGELAAPTPSDAAALSALGLDPDAAS